MIDCRSRYRARGEFSDGSTELLRSAPGGPSGSGGDGVFAGLCPIQDAARSLAFHVDWAGCHSAADPARAHVQDPAYDYRSASASSANCGASAACPSSTPLPEWNAPTVRAALELGTCPGQREPGRCHEIENGEAVHGCPGRDAATAGRSIQYGPALTPRRV